MRLILFFDLPTTSNQDLRNYRRFIKNIKSQGFYMIQESVYVKLCMDARVAESQTYIVKSVIPPEGNIIILSVTEKQFAAMNILLGESKTDVLNNSERYIEL